MGRKQKRTAQFLWSLALSSSKEKVKGKGERVSPRIVTILDFSHAVECGIVLPFLQQMFPNSRFFGAPLLRGAVDLPTTLDIGGAGLIGPINTSSKEARQVAMLDCRAGE